MAFTLVCDHSKDSRDCRNGYVDALAELLKENDKVMHVDCDLMNCINTGKLHKEYPERVINAGIAEANATGVAAGLCASGMTVFMHSFGVFASRRVFDQAFLSAAYSKNPVHIIGTDPGVTAAVNGGTHMPFEDCAPYMATPDAVVIDVCDYVQAYALTKKLAASGKFSYMRLIRKGFKTIYGDGSDFEIGKAVTLKEGNDVTLIASGIMVNNALEAQEKLEAEGIKARVIDMFTWKPLDEETLMKAIEETGAIVTCENHNVQAGLGVAVGKFILEHKPVPQEFIGVQDRFGQVGQQADLEKEYGLTADDIVKAAKKAISRK